MQQNAIHRIESFINNDPATGSVGIVNKVATLEEKINKVERQQIYWKGKMTAFIAIISFFASLAISWLKSLMQ